MKTKIETNVLIIGSGPAGYTAAIYAARANLKPHLVSGLEPGGQLTITTDVENYPGFGDVIQGPWLMEQMKEQALKVGTEFHHDIINKVSFDNNPFSAVTDSGLEFSAKSIIIATGAQARWLNIESENKFKGFGVSACATCDGFFFKDQNVIVVGGGNSAVEESLYLTNFASKVTLIHRRDSLRAEKILQERLFNHPKIDVIWNHTVDEFIGSEEPLSLNKIKIKNIKDNNEKIMEATGAFIAIGHDPSTF
ncbi:MAG: FAD-dependent oxidoreductase, partial [Pelagibacteraceae bacterium]|nr:FAD-dependent oxidoreductase [Pelagibacteraceae bacterium]